MKHLFLATAMLALAIPAMASEATFDRTLTVSGRVELSVSTGSGNVHITPGPDNRVHVFGKVRSTWGDSDERVRQIADNPPIEQAGNIIHIGKHHDGDNEGMHHVSIDYEIEAPANSYLEARDIFDESPPARIC